MSVIDRVAKGYEWLKANRAEHLAELDPNEIDVESAWYCPLGQTGDYFEALSDAVPYDNVVSWDEIHHARFDWAHEHGFAGGVYGATYSDETLDDYDALNAAWRAILT